MITHVRVLVVVRIEPMTMFVITARSEFAYCHKLIFRIRIQINSTTNLKKNLVLIWKNALID